MGPQTWTSDESLLGDVTAGERAGACSRPLPCQRLFSLAAPNLHMAFVLNGFCCCFCFLLALKANYPIFFR